MSRWFQCQGRMSAHTGIGSAQRVRPVKPYFSVKCDSLGWPISRWVWPVSGWKIVTCKVTVDCPSHLVILLSRWLLKHDTVYLKIRQETILYHNWYDVLFKKTVVDFDVTIKLSKHFSKIPPQFNFSCGFHTEIESVLTNHRAKKFRTGGKNPSYHVIMLDTSLVFNILKFEHMAIYAISKLVTTSNVSSDYFLWEFRTIMLWHDNQCASILPCVFITLAIADHSSWNINDKVISAKWTY